VLRIDEKTSSRKAAAKIKGSKHLYVGVKTGSKKNDTLRIKLIKMVKRRTL